MSTLNDISNELCLGAAVDADQYLTFMLGEEEYGVDILRVQEIKGWKKVTPLPSAPAYVRGVMNLRGTIVPVIDLRLRFSLKPIAYGPTTVVIIVRIESEGPDCVVGIVVDAVSDVYAIPPEELNLPPDLGSNIRIDFVRGLATVEEKMVIVLDVDKFLGPGDLEITSQTD